MLQAIQEIPQEHLHTFQLFIHAIKKTSGHNISLLGVCSYIIGMFVSMGTESQCHWSE